MNTVAGKSYLKYDGNGAVLGRQMTIAKQKATGFGRFNVILLRIFLNRQYETPNQAKSRRSVIAIAVSSNGRLVVRDNVRVRI